MTDHADTIRRALAFYMTGQGDNGVEQRNAIIAVNALLAERQQAQQERDKLLADLDTLQQRERHSIETLEATNATIDALREQRQQAIDALRRAREDIGLIAKTTFDMGMDGRIRRAERSCERIDAALVKLGEQP